MKKYKDETEKAIAIAKAQVRIEEFLKHDYSYAELMTMTAKAQAQVFNIINLADGGNRDEIHVEQIAEFFYFAIKAFQLLEPYSESETCAI